MLIAKDAVVTLQYRLADIEGVVLEQSEPTISYLHGGYDDIFPLVEAALEGKSVGDELSVRLEPEDAFGEYDEALLRVEPRAAFPSNVHLGMQFEGVPESGDEDDVILFTVTEMEEDRVVVDGNHPLAGKALDFLCTIVNVRAATREELAHGHVHDGSGHHH